MRQAKRMKAKKQGRVGKKQKRRTSVERKGQNRQAKLESEKAELTKEIPLVAWRAGRHVPDQHTHLTGQL